MTNTRKSMVGQYTGTMPERYGGNLLFRARYLESRWVRFIFHTLISGVAVLLVMTAVAGKVSEWQADYRQQSLTRIETELALCSQQEAAAQIAGDLTGRAAVLDRRISLLEQKQLLLSSDSASVEQELAQNTEALAQLNEVIAGTYRAAEQAYEQGNPLQAMRLFRTVGGYEEADGWYRLCSIRTQWEISRCLSYGQMLTAWVQQSQLMQQIHPEKVETIPVSFGALEGIWFCRDDQQLHMRQLATETGDGRAGAEDVDGTSTVLQPAIRCLMAKGDALYGYLAEDLPLEVSEDDFTEVICRGGILRAESTDENTNPAAAVLVLQTQSDGTQGQMDESRGIQVISENIIVVEEGAWEGTYYRILED